MNISATISSAHQQGVQHAQNPKNDKTAPLKEAENVGEPSKIGGPDAKENPTSPVPDFDEYIKGDPDSKESAGIYAPAVDENGNPKIAFDDPEAPANATPENAPDKAGESCTANTDKVDAEIKKLKEEKAKLEQEIAKCDDENKIKDLEKRLSNIESELQSKDNDTYRKQHSIFS